MEKEKMENGKLKIENSIRWIEGFFLTVILCVAALRLSFIETPQNAMQNPALWTTARGISLIISSILFLTVLIGLLLRIHKTRWHLSCWTIGLGLTLFAAAALLAIFPASNKRAAETECITLVIPILAALVAFRWMDSARRIDIVLWVVLSMGCAAVYVSFDQSMDSNQQVLDDYRKNPQQQLTALGIEPNSLAHFQYEHRLMSQDVRGFLTTSNSTGSFLLMGIFIAIGLLTDTLRSEKKDDGFAARMFIQLMILLVLIAGLLLGKSRGAIGALLLAAALFALLLSCRRWLWKYRWAVLITAAIAFAAVCMITIRYGLEHGRLPGPNAMLVRWQYWVSSIQMAADHPLLGVGGGNFATLYTHYKIPAAPETVKDPHNFVLSLLCQFGPVGVIGFLLIVFAILWRGLKNVFDPKTDLPVISNDTPRSSKDKFISLGTWVGVMFTLLYFRPITSEGGVPGENTSIRQSVFIILYLVPTFSFACSYGLLWATSRKTPTEYGRDGLTLGLICGVVAICIHNLIDFALFEPGVWTAFWLMLAVILTLGGKFSIPQTVQCKYPRWGIPAALLLAIGVLFFVRVYKPIDAGRQFQIGLIDYQNAQDYFTAAAITDPLDPDSYYTAAQWNVNQFETHRKKQTDPLDKSIQFLGKAQQRDPQNYRYLKTFSEIFQLKSEIDVDKQKELLNTAYQSALQAQRLYPGSDEIAYNLGQLAEKLEQPQDTVKHYQEAVEIENQYRIQFIQMYPNTPVFSRLGQQHYAHAKGYINQQSAAK